jgi:DNA-binding response OmpR family regulator
MNTRSLAIAEDRRRDPVWQALVDELDEVREENRQLRERIGADVRSGTVQRLIVFLGRRPGDARILAALLDAKVGVVAREALLAAQTPPGREAPVSRVLDTRLCQLRKTLKPYDIEIETVWGLGYRLTPAMKDRLREALEESEAADA